MYAYSLKYRKARTRTRLEHENITLIQFHKIIIIKIIKSFSLTMLMYFFYYHSFHVYR